jgi:hypothetical protein
LCPVPPNEISIEKMREIAPGVCIFNRKSAGNYPWCLHFQ